MKKCGRHNIRKHREIKNIEQYTALNISLKFGNMNKIKITSSKPKDYSGRSGKGLITSLSVKAIWRKKNIKKAKFAISEVSLKNLSMINKEFKDVTYEGYVRKRSKQMPTDSYFYPAIQISKFMMNNLCCLVGTQIWLICEAFLQTIANKKGLTSTRLNKNGLMLMRVLWKIANQKAFTKWI